MKIVKMLSVLFFSISCGQSCRMPIDAKVKFDYQDKIPAWLAENHVPAVGIGIIEGGRIKSLRVFGELQKNVPAPVNTIFNIASQTKPIVAMLTLKLVQSGRWSLDEPLAAYWIDPDVRNDPRSKKLTTRHVLSHQTGFVNWRIDHPSKKLAFDFEPGTKYQYSGEGFEYLRRALENKFHEPLEALLDTGLFKPLGMNDTRYWDENLDMTRFARWHDAAGNEYKTSYKTGVSAADDLLTTIEDYCKFGIDVINGAGLSADLFNDMISPQVEVKKHYYHGLGWGLVKDLPHGEYALEHGGSDIGVRTMAVFLPKSKRGIVVMTNGDNGMNVNNNVIKESLDIGKIILEYIYQSPLTREIIALSGEVIERYVGTYVQPNGRIMLVAREDNAIRVSGDGIPTFLLYPEAENKFFIKDFDVQLEFIGDENHKVIKLIIYENGKRGMEALKK
ncbi:MAG: serine hydrolase [Candidatus Aminicenantales bacterium]|jgi:CubicO group peptidase (beta-lactamase class C family)